MQVFIYQAALYCDACGKSICASLPIPAGADMDNESTWDSDDYPQGPYADGGGEADTPQHCDSCRVFLENPLTSDGVEYALLSIVAAYDEADDSKWSTGRYSDHVADCLDVDQESALATWARFYDLPDAPTNESES